MPTIEMIPNSAQSAPSQDASTVASKPAMSARERAIAILTGEAKAPAPAVEVAAPKLDLPVKNASQIAPEEMTALKATKSEESENQNDTSVDDKSAEVVTSESKAEVKAAEPDKLLSSEYANLARKEKALRAKVQEFNAEKAAIKAKEDALAAREAEIKNTLSIKDRLAQDPLGVLNELGISYEQLTERVLNEPASESRAVQKLEAEINALKASMEESKRLYEEQTKQAYDNALNQFRTEAESLVTSDPRFELTKITKSTEDVVKLIERTYQEEKRVITVEEAAEEIEKFLEEEYLEVAKTNKIRSKLLPQQQKQESQPKVEQVKAEAPKQQQVKTLSNAMSSSRPLSARERAILAFKNELK